MADPRMKFVPELEEERFQSMVAVPILAKAGDVIGVVVLHTEAPREFDDDVLNFLVHTASLVAGAIENAQLYEETRRRVQALTTLTQLSQALAAVTLREDLYDVVARGARELLRADACQIYRLDVEADELALVGSDPDGAPAPSPRPGGTGLVLDLMRRAGRPRRRARRVAKALWPDVDENALLVAPLVARDEQLGMICCLAHDRQFTEEDAELLGAVANQTAVGLKKAELIERLTAENIVKDMFDALAAGSVETAEAKANEARCDLARPHLFLHVERAPRAGDARPPGPELAARLEARLRRLYPRALFDSRHDRVRALAPLPTGEGAAIERVARGMRAAGARGGAGGRPQRRRPRRDERPAPDARSRRRGAHRPLAGRRGRGSLPTSSSGPTATWSTSSSTRRHTTATARRSRRWASTTAGAAPSSSRRSSSSSPTAAASPRAPGRSMSTQIPCASGSSESNASPSWTCTPRTSCHSSWR